MTVIINGTNTPTAGGVTYGDGTQYATTAAGTSGQLLTSNGSSAPSWTTVTVAGSGGATASGNVTLTSASSGAQSITPTGFGNTVKLPDATTMTKAACVFNIKNNGGYTVRLVDYSGGVLGFIAAGQSATVGLADNSTAAGTWIASGTIPFAVTASTNSNTINCDTVIQCISVDSDRVFILMSSNYSTGLYGIVYNSTTSTFGTATLIKSTFAAGVKYASCIKVATDSILVGYAVSTSTYGVVCSLSGTTITVNTEATAVQNMSGGTWGAFITVGSAYVANAANSIIAFTVSGTTVTIGARTNFTGSVLDAYSGVPYLVPVSSTVFLYFSYNTSKNSVVCGSVSGTTITQGTLLDLASSGSSGGYFGVLTAPYYYVVYNTGTNTWSCAVITVSGTTCTGSAVAALSSATGNNIDVLSTSNKVILMGTNTTTFTHSFNVVTNTAGTASAGTALTITHAGGVSTPYAVGIFNSNAVFVSVAQNNTYMTAKYNIDYSGASPVLSSQFDIRTVNSGGTQMFGSAFQKSYTAYRVRPATTVIGKSAYSFNNVVVGYGYFQVSDGCFNNLYLPDLPSYQTAIQGVNNNESWAVDFTKTQAGYQLIRLECATV